MAATKPRHTRSTSLRDDTDSSKMEGTGTWDTLQWTKIQPGSHYVSHANLDFLLEEENVIAQGHGVVLINSDDAGTLMVTNFRLVFLSDRTRNIIALGTIPLATIEKFNKIAVKMQSANRQSDKTPPQRLLQVIGKDMRIIVFGFRTRTKQRRVIFDALLSTKQAVLWDLYAFACGPSRFTNSSPKVRLLDEYFRLLGKRFYCASVNMIESESFILSNDLWRISKVNSNYNVCPSYPFALIVPKTISDDEVQQASSFRGRCRFPVVSWCHPGTGAVLARSSQPLVGIMMNLRSIADEKLVAGLCGKLSDGSRRKLYIADARPRKNALANGAMGGGSESSSNYFQSEVVFFGIDNIHAMRDSFTRLRECLDTHGKASSDGMSSFLRHGGSMWGGGNLSSMSTSVSTLGDSGWLLHVQNVLAGAAWIAARLDMEKASVLVHCSDGWDRTSQLVSLANLLLDPYYRTFAGFQALVEKDWLAFGHPFSDRMGMPSVYGSGNMPFELTRQPSVGSSPGSPMRQSPVSSQSSTSHAQTSSHYSPIFLQWVDCVSQLLRMYPFAFEFSSVFLVDFLDCFLSCRFGNFLCNSEKERQQCNVFEACGCLWAYLADLRASEGKSHVHYNLYYDPLKHNGPIFPPAAALAPTLWPQFLLRWACPEEAQAAGEIEAECRQMFLKFSEIQKAKELAERKAKEIEVVMESLSSELQTEKQLRWSTTNMNNKTSRENVAIKRAIQSLGCRFHLSDSGDCVFDIESNLMGSSQTTMHLSTWKDLDSSTSHDDKKDPSVSVAATEDDDHDDLANNPIVRVCEALCSLHTPNGRCKWPNAGCARLSSQLVGLRANFDAFDQLSIDENYFKSE
ncbi:hypothetical protein K1719_004555 [Acacia pycnantha]|nr:hypothetical protein K1719_004555 [Acacia pycnantha]